jgi:hypothetical protein
VELQVEQATEWEFYPVAGDGGIDSLCTSADLSASAWGKAKWILRSASNDFSGERHSVWE